MKHDDEENRPVFLGLVFFVFFGFFFFDGLASFFFLLLFRLQAPIQHHYETLDSNMSHDNLQEVVQRITAAMPSPLHKSDTRKVSA
jgi:hypothetical protein